MPRFIPSFLTFFLLAAIIPSHSVQSNPLGSEEPKSGSVLCAPAVYPLDPNTCLALGPSQYLTEMAEEGITFPILPLPAYPPSPDLMDIPYRYFRVDAEGTGVYSSLEAAISGQASDSIQSGNLLYVSYQRMDDTTGPGVYFQLRSGYWIRGEGSRISFSTFQGLLFSSTPRNSFGWVLEETTSRSSPGYGGQSTRHNYRRLKIVQVYEVQTVGHTDWVMIAPQEWVEARKIDRVDIRRTPPDGVTSSRWIEINLQEQTLTVYQDNRLIFATLIASGVEPFWTRPGLFQIYEKLLTDTMTTSDPEDHYYLEDVPYTMYFDDRRALHGSYWRTLFGYPQSHGCVNLSIGDSAWLYHWANLGEWVYVYDPSNQTPTDPALFASGGAP